MLFSNHPYKTLFGALTFLGLTQAAIIPNLDPRSTPESSVPVTLFREAGPVYTDVTSRPESIDDPQICFPTIAAILANINSTDLAGIFDQRSISGEMTIVGLNSVNGTGVQSYTVNHGEALAHGVNVLSDPNVIWPAVLRSAIKQHGIIGIGGDKQNDKLGKGDQNVIKDCLKAITGEEYKVESASVLGPWTTWQYFSPELYPYILQTKSNPNDCKVLKPNYNYGVLAVHKANESIDLYDPDQKVGRANYLWSDVEGDLDTVNWRADLEVSDNAHGI